MEQRQALAGFALSGALFVLALPIPSSAPKLCRDPVELAAVGPHTAVVRCDARPAGAGRIRGPVRRLFGLPIELNCADARTLESLEGIGSVRAQRIVEERERRRFERVDDLLRVRGIGPKTLENLRLLVDANVAAPKSGSSSLANCRPEAVGKVKAGLGGRI